MTEHMFNAYGPVTSIVNRVRKGKYEKPWAILQFEVSLAYSLHSWSPANAKQTANAAQNAVNQSRAMWRQHKMVGRILRTDICRARRDVYVYRADFGFPKI